MPNLAGFVRDRFRDDIDDRDEDRFVGKIHWNARWQFSPAVSLTLIAGTQIEELAFGGGARSSSRASDRDLPVPAVVLARTS